MIIAQVKGHVWSTRKYDSLNGYKLMLVETIGGSDAGRELIAIDTLGAGTGDRVILTQGSAARKGLEAETHQTIPVDALVIGIIDEDCNLGGEAIG